MSKHKHFHNIKNPAQMLQHARREKISYLDPGRTLPKKKAAHDTDRATDGKEAAPSDAGKSANSHSI